jgi:hypothetical protein
VAPVSPLSPQPAMKMIPATAAAKPTFRSIFIFPVSDQ